MSTFWHTWADAHQFLVWGGRGLKFGACVRDVCPCQMVYFGQKILTGGPRTLGKGRACLADQFFGAHFKMNSAQKPLFRKPSQISSIRFHHQKEDKILRPKSDIFRKIPSQLHPWKRGRRWKRWKKCQFLSRIWPYRSRLLLRSEIMLCTKM